MGEDLSIYKDKYGIYPKSIDILVTEGQFKQVPDDNGKPYNYTVTQNGNSAKISQKLHFKPGYWCWNSNFPDVKLFGKAKEVISETECQP